MLRFATASLFATTLLVIPLQASAAPWVVDNGQSTLQFSGKQGDEAFTGGFKKFTPTIELDLAHPEQGKIDVTVDMTSGYIDNDKDKQAALPTDTWLGVKQFPAAKFHSTAIQASGPQKYVVTGELSLHGISKSITFPFTLEPSGAAMKATGTIELKRNEFGIGQGKEWSSDQWIAYPVTVKFTVLATPGK